MSKIFPPVLLRPVHVSEAGQDVGCFSKAAILLIVAPQQVHVVNFALVLFYHVHQVFFKVRRVYLGNKCQMNTKMLRIPKTHRV